MREFFDLMKEILLIKKETQSDIGLASLKRTNFMSVNKRKKKIKKEVSLSELMRRH